MPKRCPKNGNFNKELYTPPGYTNLSSRCNFIHKHANRDLAVHKLASLKHFGPLKHTGC